MFASSIPEIIELVGSGSKYGGELKREHGKRYIENPMNQWKIISVNPAKNFFVISLARKYTKAYRNVLILNFPNFFPPTLLEEK